MFANHNFQPGRDSGSDIRDINGEIYYDHLEKVLQCIGPRSDPRRHFYDTASNLKAIDQNVIVEIHSDREYVNLRFDSFKRCHYHNGDHWDSVTRRAVTLANYQCLSQVELQFLNLFGMFHDIFHEGTICGNDWERNVLPSIKLAHQICTKHNVPEDVSLKLLCMLASSTAHDDKFLPTNNLSRTAVMADLGSFVEGLEKFLDESVKVLMEIPMNDRPVDFGDWVIFQQKFCTDYIKPRLEVALDKHLVPQEWYSYYLETYQFLNHLAGAYKEDRIFELTSWIGHGYITCLVDKVEHLLQPKYQLS